MIRDDPVSERVKLPVPSSQSVCVYTNGTKSKGLKHASHGGPKKSL